MQGERERESGGGEKPPRHRKLIHATKVGHCAFARECLPITFTNYAIATAYRLLPCPKHRVILPLAHLADQLNAAVANPPLLAS